MLPNLKIGQREFNNTILSATDASADVIGKIKKIEVGDNDPRRGLPI